MKQIIIFCLLLTSVAVRGQYNPSTATVTNKPLGIAQAVPTDARSYYYDASLFIWRPYQSTAEVLSYLNLTKYRIGQFPIFVNEGGALQSNGSFVGGTIKEYWFKDGTSNASLILKTVSQYNDSLARLAVGTMIDVRWYGAVAGTNSTTAINNAIIAAHGKYPVLITGGGTYYIDAVADGIQMLSNTRLIIDKSTTVRAIPNNSGVYSIIAIRNKTNVTVEGEGLIYGERNDHIGSTGEYGMGITVDQSSNVIVKGVKIMSCWGDGIYVGGGTIATQCKNITFEYVTVDSCRRQGLSLTNVKGFKASYCRFINTRGTLPYSGVDLENNANQSVDEFAFYACELTGNQGSGVNGYGAYNTGFIKKGSFSYCNFSKNDYDGVNISTVYPYIHADIYFDMCRLDSNGHRPYSIERATNSNLTNSNINHSGTLGIYTGNLTGGSIENVTINDSSASNTGISMLGVNTNFSIRNNKIRVKNYGIYSIASSSNTSITVSGNRIFAKNATGLWPVNFYNSTVSDNSFDTCGTYGIRSTNDSNTVFSRNKITGSGHISNNVYAAVLVDSGYLNVFESNTIRDGGLANKMRYALQINANSGKNYVINNDFDNSLYVTSLISDLSSNSVIIYNKYKQRGTTANIPTSPDIPLHSLYFSTDELVLKRNYASGLWSDLNYVRKDGTGHSPTDLTNLTGSPIAGSIVGGAFTASPSGAPVSAGYVVTVNGTDYEGCFSLLESRVGNAMYIQHYNSSGVGSGWGEAINQGSTTTARGISQFATTSEINAGTSDFKGINPLQLQGSKYIDQSGSKTYSQTTGTNAYSASISPAIASYSSGQQFYIKFNNSNTGASTINLNSLGAKSIVKNGATSLASGDIGSNQIYQLVYDGTNFQISNNTAAQRDTSSGATATATIGQLQHRLDSLSATLIKTGIAFFSGDGSTTTFDITLPTTPTWANAEASSAAGANITYRTQITNGIRIFYAVAPASGSNNISISYQYK